VTRKQLEAQDRSTKETLKSQERINEATLRTQREIAIEGFQTQRQLASDDRLWNARREIYVRLLAIARKVTRQASSHAYKDVPQPQVFVELLQPLIDMEDEVVAHASPAVMEAANQLNMNLQATISFLHVVWSNQQQAGPEIKDFLDALRELYESNKQGVDATLMTLAQLAANLTTLIRAELNDLPPRRDDE